MGKKSIMRMLLTLSISQICYMFIVVIMFGLGVFFLGETEIIISPNVISQNVEIIKEKALPIKIHIFPLISGLHPQSLTFRSKFLQTFRILI